MEKLYKSVNGVKMEFSPEDYAQYELDRIEYETNTLPREIRTERNRLIAESDWTQAKDIPDSVSAVWAAYRQALRDVPQQPGFPTNVTWPIRPDQPATSGTQDL